MSQLSDMMQDFLNNDNLFLRHKKDNLICISKPFPPLRIDDNVVKKLCEQKFYIWIVKHEEYAVKEQFLYDYSSILTDFSNNPNINFSENQCKIPELQEFSLSITTDQQLLSPMYRHYLNPLEVTIIGVKNLPKYKQNYQPVSISFRLFNHTQKVSTSQYIPKFGSQSIRMNYKHVFLLGLIDQVKLIESIESQFLQFEIHDKDTIVEEKIMQDSELTGLEQLIEAANIQQQQQQQQQAFTFQKNAPKTVAQKKVQKKTNFDANAPIQLPQPFINSKNHGITSVSMKMLLNPTLKTVKLKCNVHPQKQADDEKTIKEENYQNLDLNMTARKEIVASKDPTTDETSYFANETFLLVRFQQSHLIGTFKQSDYPVEEEVVVPVKTVTKQQQDSKAAVNKKLAALEKRLAPKQEEEPPKEEIEIKPKEVRKHAPVLEKTNRSGAIYERAVFIIPYNNSEFVQKLQHVINIINLEGMGITIGGVRSLSTHVFTEQELQNKELDFIGGFEIIDCEYRMYCLEGVSYKGMAKFISIQNYFFFLRLEELIPRDSPNSEELKYLKNKEILFKERLYTSFNLNMKIIKLRESLGSILAKAGIYLRSQVSAQTQRILVSFLEMRNAKTMKQLANSDLFPSVQDLIGIERTYSDSLGQEDLTGIKEDRQKLTKKPVKNIITLLLNSKRQKHQSLDQTHTTTHIGQSFVTGTSKNQENDLKPLNKTQPNTIMVLEEGQQTGMSKTKTSNLKNMRSQSLGQTSKIISKETYTIRMRKIPQSQQQQPTTPCYIYACQALNYYEQQKQLLREQIRKKPNNFYTYSNDYLSLSIDPFDPKVVQKEEEKKEKFRLSQKKPFIPLPKKSYIETIRPQKQLHYSKVEELQNSQWWVEKTRVQEKDKQTMLESQKQLEGKPKFVQKVKGVTYFSEPEVYEAEKITAVEKEKQMKEAKQKEHELWKSKLQGPIQIYTNNYTKLQESQIDKLKGLLTNPPMKRSLMLSPSKLAESTLGMTKTLQPAPASMYIYEEYQGGPVREILRDIDNTKVINEIDFQRYSRTNPMTQSIVSKIAKEVNECS